MATGLKFEGFTPRFRGGRVYQRCRGGSDYRRYKERSIQSPSRSSESQSSVRALKAYRKCQDENRYQQGRSRCLWQRWIKTLSQVASFNLSTSFNILLSLVKFIKIPAKRIDPAKEPINNEAVEKYLNVNATTPPKPPLKSKSFVLMPSIRALRASSWSFLSIVHLIALPGRGWTDRRGIRGLANHLFDAIEGFGFDVVDKKRFDPIRYIFCRPPTMNGLGLYSKHFCKTFFGQPCAPYQLIKFFFVHLTAHYRNLDRKIISNINHWLYGLLTKLLLRLYNTFCTYPKVYSKEPQ